MALSPNIVFLFSDQQRWDTVGCYGGPDITPNLDQLAREGVRFEHAFTCQPVCGPARAALQTGRYPTEMGCYRNAIALPSTERTLAHWLSEAGYETGYIGKWHLASTQPAANYETSAVPPDRRGGYRDFWLAADVLEYTSHGYDGYLFDGEMKKVEFKGYRVDCITDFAIQYLRTRDQSRPFFLFVSYIEPHHQNDHNRFEGPEGSKSRFKNFTAPADLAGTEGNWRENYPDYLGSIHSLDRNVGRIAQTLEQLGLRENTVIVYTSDHGCHFRTRNKEYKRSCHESSIRIPMIVSGPGFAGGKVVKELVSLIDLPPTVLDAGGLRKPESMRGQSLKGLLEGRYLHWPEEVFIQISESQVGRAIRTLKWKYSVRAPEKDGGRDPGSDRYREEFLYDLENDPNEKNNLVAVPDYRAVREMLALRLKRRMVAAGEKEPVIEPSEPG